MSVYQPTESPFDHDRYFIFSYFLRSFPNICGDFGFPVANDRDTSGVPSQSRLWEMWNKEFTEVQREFVRTTTEEALAFAREQGIPVRRDTWPQIPGRNRSSGGVQPAAPNQRR